jgi:hypothetical protein
MLHEVPEKCQNSQFTITSDKHSSSQQQLMHPQNVRPHFEDNLNDEKLGNPWPSLPVT